MKRISILIIALALLLCSCSAVDFDGGNASTKPIEKMMKAALACDGEDYLAAFPPEMTAEYEEKQVYAVWFSFGSMKEWLSAQKEKYTEYYGADLEIEAEVVKTVKCTVADVEDMNPDPYTYVSYVTKSNTESVCAVTVEYTIEGDSGEEDITKVIYTVKQGGKWYVHPIHAFDSFAS